MNNSSIKLVLKVQIVDQLQKGSHRADKSTAETVFKMSDMEDV